MTVYNPKSVHVRYALHVKGRGWVAKADTRAPVYISNPLYAVLEPNLGSFRKFKAKYPNAEIVPFQVLEA